MTMTESGTKMLPYIKHTTCIRCVCITHVKYTIRYMTDDVHDTDSAYRDTCSDDYFDGNDVNSDDGSCSRRQR